VSHVSSEPNIARQTAQVGNRRRERRFCPKGGAKVRCYGNPLGLGPNIAASFLDISETGARLILKTSVTPGQEVAICLEGISGNLLKRVAEVVWVVPTADGAFCVGARLQKALPYTSIHDLSKL
jgi:hypothetical protein